MQDSLRLSDGAKMAPMRGTETLKTRVPRELKLQAKAVADQDFLSEAAWLKRLVMRALQARDDASAADIARGGPMGIVGSPQLAGSGTIGAGKPMLVRLSVEDRLLLL